MLKFWKRINDLPAYLALLIFAFIIFVGVWQALDGYYLFSHTIDTNIRQYKPDPEKKEEAAASPITNDMRGWITIDETGIDYPVMQAKDNTYYLNTDPFGEYSFSGSIFLDSRCSPDFSDYYSLIYGHHMNYGRMFGALDDFLDGSYLAGHSEGTLYVGRDAEEVYKLKVFAAMRVSARERIVFDLSQDEIESYILSRTGASSNDPGGRLLALSTCVDAGSYDRIIVFCRILDN